MGLLKWAGYGAAGWLAWRVLGPEIVPRFPNPQTSGLPVPGRTIIAGENELFVREAGDPEAPPLVLIHGWNLEGALTFHRIVASLAEDHRVIVPDLRNHGRSEWVRGKIEVADLADDVATLLDALGVSGATVLGYSMGGMVLQELARRHPRHVAGMILAATAARPIARARPVARGLFLLGRTGLRISNREAARVTGELLYRGGAVLPQHRLWLHQALLRRDPDLYYEIGAAVWRFDSRSWVGRLPQRKMVVIPTEDQVVPPSAQYELAGLLPDADLVEVVGGHHEAVLNRPEEFVAAVRRFVG